MTVTIADNHNAILAVGSLNDWQAEAENFADTRSESLIAAVWRAPDGEVHVRQFDCKPIEVKNCGADEITLFLLLHSRTMAGTPSKCSIRRTREHFAARF